MSVRSWLIVVVSGVFGLASGTDAQQDAKRVAAPDEDKQSLRIETLPADRGAQMLVGRKFPRLSLEGDAPLDSSKPGQLTLFRWWTDDCIYCKRSLPAIEQFRKKYESRGLRTVAVYHAKPPSETVDQDAMRREAARLGYNGPVAFDGDWSELRVASTGADKAATSMSFLVDADGVIRFVHPGPQFFASDHPAAAQHAADYRLIDKAIDQLLE